MKIEEAYARLNIVRDYIPEGNSNRPGTRLRASKITVHNTDNTNSGANAAAHARYQKGADARRRRVSWHFTVDDGPVYQSLPTNEVGWHAGSSDGNNSSIGIEICMHPEMNTKKGYDNAALLVAVLAFERGIRVPEGVVQHNWWSGKHCPRVLRDRSGAWDEFLNQADKHWRDLERLVAPDIEHVGEHHEGEVGIIGPDAGAGNYMVTASSGLRVRAGPGIEFDVISGLPFGTVVAVISRSGTWLAVDSTGDGGIDGFVHSAFLRPV